MEPEALMGNVTLQKIVVLLFLMVYTIYQPGLTQILSLG